MSRLSRLFFLAVLILLSGCGDPDSAAPADPTGTPSPASNKEDLEVLSLPPAETGNTVSVEAQGPGKFLLSRADQGLRPNSRCWLKPGVGILTAWWNDGLSGY